MIDQPVYPTEGLFKAADDEVGADVVDLGPGPSFAGVEARGLTPIEMATLGEVLGVAAYDDLADPMFAEERGGQSGECGVFPVLDSIRDALAAATDLDGIAAKWAETDELRSWEPAEVRRVVRDASELARTACDEGRHLWIWWTL